MAEAKGTRKIKVHTAAIIGAIWTGLFGFNFAASYLLSGQLFTLILVSLIVGTVLTVAVLIWSILVIREAKGDVDADVDMEMLRRV